MKICIIGTGYVGLVVGTCFANLGNQVICIDNNLEKIKNLQKGIIPICEPGLSEILNINTIEKRLKFSADLQYGVQNSFYIFMAVPTPEGRDGEADLNCILDVTTKIGQFMNSEKIIVIKSTVPVGTNQKIKAIIDSVLLRSGKDYPFDVVSNPEFLKEGEAVWDFLNPDRVIIGTDCQHTAQKMKELYAPITNRTHPVIIMKPISAEITKYAANCILATKISFMNEVASLCDLTRADITEVKNGLAGDPRIGEAFLNAGLGYGGSCFPKDIKALQKTLVDLGHPSHLLKAVEEINIQQRTKFLQKIFDFFKDSVIGKTFVVWGLAFKPNTNDIREAPSIPIIQELLNQGAKIRAFDPEANQAAEKLFKGVESGKIQYYQDQYEAVEDADSLLLMTEWSCFQKPDFQKLWTKLKAKVIFDGRNLWDPVQVKRHGLQYFGMGRT